MSVMTVRQAHLSGLSKVSEIASRLSKSFQHVQLNQRLRSRGMTGLFRQGELCSALCRIVAGFSSVPCPLMLCLMGECTAQQKEIHHCRGDLRLSDYDYFLKGSLLHLNWTLILKKNHSVNMLMGYLKALTLSKP